MSDEKYYAILTDLGQQLITAAYQAGEVVTITQMAFGDAGQVYVAPDPAMTALVSQTDILPLVRGPQAEDIIGGGIDILSDDYPDSWIYEVGLFDADGNLIIYASYPPTLIPPSTDSVKKGVSLDIGMVMSATDNITVYVDPKIEALTREVADTLYLQITNNLSEIADQGADAQGEARESIGCGTAATHDVTESYRDSTPGRVMLNGDHGLGGPEVNVADGSDIYNFFATAVSGNYGGGSDLINVVTSGYRCFKWQQHGGGNLYGILIETGSTSGQMAIHVYNNPTGDMATPEKYWTNTGIFYSPKNKPTAVDVNALPLSKSGLAIDLNTLGANSSAGIYYQPASANATTANNYPIQEAGTLLVTPSAYGSQQEYTAFGTGRKFFRGLTGNFSTNGPWHDWIEYITDATSNSKFVQGVQLGAESSMAASGGSGDSQTAKVPAGNAVTGTHSNYNDSNWELDTLYFKPIQEDVNGTWKTIEG
jgi:hypothetical protein